jgi:hypothetical protein
VDRRFAAYAAGLDDIDEGGLYGVDFVGQEVKGEARTMLLDFVRQGKEFAESGIDRFYSETSAELVDVLDGFSNVSLINDN